MSSKSQTLVMSRNVGEIIPRDFVEKAVAAYPTWGGLAIIDGEDLVAMPTNDAPDVDVIMGIQEDNTNNGILFVLAREEGEVSADNLQPFTILATDTGDPTMVAFVSGEFSKFKDDKSNQSAAYRVVQKLLAPKLKQFYRMAKGDMSVVMAEVKEPSFEEEFTASVCTTTDEPYMICLMSSVGNPITYYQGKNIGEFKWGIVSDSLGYDEFPKAAEQPDEPAKPLSTREKLALRKAGGKPTTETAMAAAIKEAEVKAGSPVRTVQTTTVDSKSTSTQEVRGRPPGGLSNGKTRDWFSRYTKKSPPHNFKERPWVAIHPTMVAEYLASKGEVQTIAGTTPASTPAARVAKPAVTVVAAAAAKPDVKIASKLLLSAEEKAKLPNFFKTFDINSLEVISPERMDKEEKLVPSAIEVSPPGCLENMDDVLKWPPEAFELLVREHPKYAALLMRDMQWTMISLAHEVPGEETVDTSGTVRKAS